jgi:nucleoside-diphosphate-sugar epimerase
MNGDRLRSKKKKKKLTTLSCFFFAREKRNQSNRKAKMSTILILGGTGFIGRNLVEHLAASGLFKKIRVADKTMPALANLSAKHKTLFESDLIDYKQANLANQSKKFEERFFNFFFFFSRLPTIFFCCRSVGHIDRVFKEDFGKWDFVVNLAAETKYGQTEQV